MILNEANYLYVDLQPLLTKAAQLETAAKTGEQPPKAEDSETAVGEDAAGLPTDRTQAATHQAWGDLLTSRLAENKTKGDTKEDDATVIDKFFSEYFTAVWGGDAGAQLIKMGSLLSKDIRHFGWDIKKNPVLAFIAQTYVTENLLAKRLLNGNTFKAIHNALAQKLVAQSEFLGTKNYNIIYCPSLYRRMPADMLEYLKRQKTILDPTKGKVTPEMQKRNKLTFLLLKKNNGATAEDRAEYQYTHGQEQKTLPKLLQADTKLVDIETVDLIQAKYGYTSPKKETSVSSDEAVEAIVGAFDKHPAYQYALMQYLSVTANEEDAVAIEQFLATDKFSSVTAEQVLEATKKIRKELASKTFKNANIKALIKGFSAPTKK